MKKEDKVGKAEKADHEVENKKVNNNKGKQQQQQPQDLRGFFQGGALESEKKGVRQAPGPITRERLEQVEAREQGMTTLTQLKKREPGGKQEEKVEYHQEGCSTARFNSDRSAQFLFTLFSHE
mgnify:CR=1 FL=1